MAESDVRVRGADANFSSEAPSIFTTLPFEYADFALSRLRHMWRFAF